MVTPPGVPQSRSMAGRGHKPARRSTPMIQATQALDPVATVLGGAAFLALLAILFYLTFRWV